MQGATDNDLCEAGRAQLPYLAEYFSNIALDAIYCSDTKRCKSTAKAIAIPQGLPLIVCDDLRERSAGKYENWPIVDLLRLSGAESINGKPLHPIQFILPDSTAETIPAVYERMRNVVSKIITENEGKAVAIVSHGMALQLAIAFLTNEDIRTFTGKRLENLSVSKALVNEAMHGVFECFGDIRFLEK